MIDPLRPRLHFAAARVGRGPKMARILIYAMNYAPEMAGVGIFTGEIGEYLAEMGDDVTIVTTPPHYPGWKVQGPYRNGWYVSERRGRVKVIRCPLVLRERMGGVWRFIAPLTFALSSAPVALWQILRYRPQTVLCVEPTLMAAPVTLAAARIVGARAVLHVQDLEVDASFAIGHLARKAWLKRLAFSCERTLLRRFNRLITISERMAERLEAKGLRAERIGVVRNWVDLDRIKPLQERSSYRRELGFSDAHCVVLYSGNLGAKQGLDSLIDAANLLSERLDIKFVIAGEGPAKSALIKRAAHLHNVRFLPFQPYARLSEFLGLADIHILAQAADAADLVLPSKLGGMLASGRRIIVTAAPNTELAAFLMGAVIFAPPGNGSALAAAIERAGRSKGERDTSIDARRRLASRLSKTEGLKAFRSIAMRP